MREKIYIGIDPGIVSGFAIWQPKAKVLENVDSFKLHQLFSKLETLNAKFDMRVFVENPNTWIGFYGKSEPSRLQGAGAVKQTYKHIIEFLADNKIDYTPTKLQGNMKKVKSELFKQITGYQGTTNEHGRDAAMIVFDK